MQKAKKTMPSRTGIPPDAQADSLYEDFFTGDVTVTANLINAGVEATTASFRAPDVYATKGLSLIHI